MLGGNHAPAFAGFMLLPCGRREWRPFLDLRSGLRWFEERSAMSPPFIVLIGANGTPIESQQCADALEDVADYIEVRRLSAQYPRRVPA